VKATNSNQGEETEDASMYHTLLELSTHSKAEIEDPEGHVHLVIPFLLAKYKVP
jgi:hypothetical protein